MSEEQSSMTLSNIGGGVVEEKFAEELQKVLNNIVDVNTEVRAMREIIIKIKFKPDEERNSSAVTVSTSCKLAGDKAYDTRTFIGKRADGTGEAHEHNPKQMQFMFDRCQKPSITNETNVTGINEGEVLQEEAL